MLVYRLQGHKFEEEEAHVAPGADSSAPQQPSAAASTGDLLDLDSGTPKAAAAPKPAGGLDDLLGGLDISSTPAADFGTAPLPVLFQDFSKGVTVSGRMVRMSGTIGYQIQIQNSSPNPLDGFMIQTNRSSFGITPSNQVVNIPTLAPGASGRAVVPMTIDPAKVAPGPVAPTLQVGMVTWSGMQSWSDHTQPCPGTDIGMACQKSAEIVCTCSIS